MSSSVYVEISRDQEAELPVPTAFRPLVVDAVREFCAGNFALDGLSGRVSLLSQGWAAIISDAISDYGETLAPLDDATWETSTCLCMGDYWQLVADLSTVESGLSDLIIDGRIVDAGPDDGPPHFQLVVCGVYVP